MKSVQVGAVVGRRRVVQRCLLVAWAASFPWLTFCAATHAARLRLLAAKVTAFSSDGTRYVAWQTAPGSVVVFDTRTGRRADIAIPGGCALQDQERNEDHRPPAAAGRFLLACPAGGLGRALLDAHTHGVTTLPTSGLWEAVGSAYVEGDAGNECSQTAREARQPCIALYDIATGVVSTRPQSQLGDVNRRGAPRICARVRDRVLAERAHEAREELFVYGEGVFVRSRDAQGVDILGCRGQARILHASGQLENLQLGGGILTWDTGNPGSVYKQPGVDTRSGMLWSYEFSNGRRQYLKLPRLPVVGGEEGPTVGILGYSAHADHMAFWIAAHTVEPSKVGAAVLTESVYDAPLR